MSTATSPTATLINHPNNKLIKWNESTHTFTVERFGVLEGITKILSTHIYPNYDDQFAWNNRDKTGEEKTAKERRNSGNAKGREFGKNMHKQVHTWVQCNTGKNPRPFREFFSEPHCYLRKLFGFLKAKELIPVESEFSIWDGSLRLATNIDMIAEHKSGLLVPIELKFGFNGFGLVHNANMQPPFQLWPNHAVNQWQIQLLLQTAMLIQNYAIPLSHMRPLVVWIHDNGVYGEPLSEAAILALPVLVQKLKARPIRSNPVSSMSASMPSSLHSHATNTIIPNEPTEMSEIMELLNNVTADPQTTQTQTQPQSQTRVQSQAKAKQSTLSSNKETDEVLLSQLD